jgi:unsaturated rhamnogalacturonyl hydrolase
MLKELAPLLPAREDRLLLLRKVADSIKAMRFETWNFGDSTGFEALIESSRVLGDPALFSYAHGWMRSWATRQEPFRRLDCTAPGLAMVEVATETNDGALFEALIRLARYLMSRPIDRGIYDTWDRLCLIPPYGGEPLPPREAAWLAEPPKGTCVDCLHFDPPFFTALGIAVDEPEFVQIGVDQALAYIGALQQPSGLFDHFFMRDVEGTFGPGWGRGQGWALLGLLDVHKLLPTEHPVREEIAKSVRRQVEAMLDHQRPDGRWWCVVDEPTSGEEGSTAAFMATGFLRAIKQGIYPKVELEKPALLALAGAIDDVDEQSHLTNVTAAVMASTRKSHYIHTPRGFLVPWGQGPLALAICEAAQLP